MVTAVQVVLNGHGHTVVRDLRRAFEHIARTAFPTDDRWKDMEGDGGFPMLAAVGEGGSYFHRVRYAILGESHESVVMVTHDLDREPGHYTATDRYDLVSEFDPSFLVSRYLFWAHETEKRLDDLAVSLETEVEDGLREGGRILESLEAFVDRLRRYQRDFGGPEVIPAVGDAEEILNDLPSLARAKFEEIAAKAFPEDAHTIRP